jgi:general stress protein CsbA
MNERSKNFLKWVALVLLILSVVYFLLHEDLSETTLILTTCCSVTAGLMYIIYLIGKASLNGSKEDRGVIKTLTGKDELLFQVSFIKLNCHGV